MKRPNFLSGPDWGHPSFKPLQQSAPVICFALFVSEALRRWLERAGPRSSLRGCPDTLWLSTAAESLRNGTLLHKCRSPFHKAPTPPWSERGDMTSKAAHVDAIHLDADCICCSILDRHDRDCSPLSLRGPRNGALEPVRPPLGNQQRIVPDSRSLPFSAPPDWIFLGRGRLVIAPTTATRRLDGLRTETPHAHKMAPTPLKALAPLIRGSETQTLCRHVAPKFRQPIHFPVGRHIAEEHPKPRAAPLTVCQTWRFPSLLFVLFAQRGKTFSLSAP